MSDAALTNEVQKLAKQIDALAAEIRPNLMRESKAWWRRADGLGAAVRLLALLGVEQQLGSVRTQIQRLDDRLTPAIDAWPPAFRPSISAKRWIK
jgi:hypothetical protein